MAAVPWRPYLDGGAAGLPAAFSIEECDPYRCMIEHGAFDHVHVGDVDPSIRSRSDIIVKDGEGEGRGGGRAALELLHGCGTLEERSIELLGAKPELLEPSERRKLDPADVLGSLAGLAFGATIF